MKLLDDVFGAEPPKQEGPRKLGLVTAGMISPELFHERYVLGKRERVEVEFEVVNPETGEVEPDNGTNR